MGGNQISTGDRIKTTSVKRAAALVYFTLLLGSAPARGIDVSERALMSHVRFLASENLEGRLAGSAGDRIAELYIQTIFEQAKLELFPPFGDYTQEITLVESTLDRENTYLAVLDGGETVNFVLDRDVFFIIKGHTSLAVEAPVVFAGFGITAPEYDYDDYAGLDVEGKVVLVLNNEPGGDQIGDKFRGRAPTRYSFPRAKEAIAREHGAVGLIVVSNAGAGPDVDVTVREQYGRELRQPYLGFEDGEEQIPLFFATETVADALLAGTGIDLVGRQERIEKTIKPFSVEIPGKKARLSVQVASVEKKQIANVAGYLEGNDPTLKHELIVVAAHHDHLGKNEDGTIYYGADDNASGVAGLLEASRIFAGGAGRLERSLLFVSFCAEERGLLGSKYFVGRLPEYGHSLRVMINMDMIGRNNMDKAENENMFILFTSAQTPALEKIARLEAKALDLDVRVAPYLRFRGASDHTVFHDSGFPVVFYFSGFHSDYNRPTDTPDKIFPSKIVGVVSHVCRLVTTLGTNENIDLEFDRGITVEPQKDHFENPFAGHSGRRRQAQSKKSP